jgi:hypothetical protein
MLKNVYLCHILGAYCTLWNFTALLYVLVESRFMQQSGSWQAAGRQCKVNCLASRHPAIYILTSIRSLDGKEVGHYKGTRA